MTEEEITRVLRDMGQPAFRGKQVFTWLHRGVRSFDEMSNLSKPLRQQLAQAYTISVPTVARKQESRLDGTIKYLWELPDGNCIETVLMQYHHGNTVCSTSQAGGRMGCACCASRRTSCRARRSRSNSMVVPPHVSGGRYGSGLMLSRCSLASSQA